jgi:hypothetical protein
MKYLIEDIRKDWSPAYDDWRYYCKTAFLNKDGIIFNQYFDADTKDEMVWRLEAFVRALQVADE